MTTPQEFSRSQAPIPPVHEPLPSPVWDSHTHLEKQSESVGAALGAAAAVGVRRVVQVGTDVESSRWGVAEAAKHERLRATVAVHPNDAPLLDDLDTALEQIDGLAARGEVVGIGET
ncbi:MAG: TatD family hydrolase, partial [Mycobacteriales bacterium]